MKPLKFKETNFWGQLLLEFDLGRYFGGFAQFFLIIALSIKSFFPTLSIKLYIPILFICIVLIWFLGFIILKSGLYKKYQHSIPYPFKEKTNL